jgi:hypothetical protein
MHNFYRWSMVQKYAILLFLLSIYAAFKVLKKSILYSLFTMDCRWYDSKESFGFVYGKFKNFYWTSGRITYNFLWIKSDFGEKKIRQSAESKFVLTTSIKNYSTDIVLL